MTQRVAWCVFFGVMELLCVASVHALPAPSDALMPRKQEREVESSLQKGASSSQGTEVFNKGPGLQGADLVENRFDVFVESRLDEEIEVAEKLLTLETACTETAPMGVRLADLYWEKSKRFFFKINGNDASAKDKEASMALMKSYQEKSLRAYGRIIEDCPLYDDLAKVLFYNAKSLVEVDRFKEALVLFQKIIQKYPSSEWVQQAWFMVGEYHFNEKADVVGALKAYEKAASKPSAVYGFALYKQGWCYINAGEWDLALTRFRKVFQTSSEQAVEERVRVMLRKEALKDYVRAYAQTGYADKAWGDFVSLAGLQDAWGMMEHLGQWYVAQGAHHKVVLVYQTLKSKDPKHLKKALYQAWMLEAVSKMGSHKSVVAYLHQLVQDMQTTVWPEVLPEETARVKQETYGVVESTLRKLALEYHKNAKKLRAQAQDVAYDTAQELYRQYLVLFDKDPVIQEVYYPFYMHFYYAELLYRAQEYALAAYHYGRVVELRDRVTDVKKEEWVSSAAEEAVRAYDVLVQNDERKHPMVLEGSSPKDIPDVKKKLIQACETYQKVVGEKGSKYVEITYKMGRVYYTYNHFDKALSAFFWLTEHVPENPVSCYAANLVLDILNGQKNYEALQKKAAFYAVDKKLSCSEEDRKKFVLIEMQASFQWVKAFYEEAQKYEEAAKAYEKFYAHYPLSEYADDALYNAALNYLLAGFSDEAYRVRVFLIEKMPQSPLAPETMLAVASVLEQRLEIKKSADFLEKLYETYPSHPKAKDALYNAFVYREALGDKAKTLRGKRLFVQKYPSDKDVPVLQWALCEEEVEKEAKASCAKAVWESAFQAGRYQVACEALKKQVFHWGEFPEKKRSSVEAWWKSLSAEKRSSYKGCADAFSYADLKTIEAGMVGYKALAIAQINPTEKGRKAFEASVKRKTQARDGWVEKLRVVVGYGSAEYVLEAMFRIGEVYEEVVQKLLNAPVPHQIEGYVLTQEDTKALRAQLKEMSLPVQKEAWAAYRLCVEQSSAWHMRTPWTERAEKALSVEDASYAARMLEKVFGWPYPQPTAFPVPGPLVWDGKRMRVLSVMETQP